ncbi:MAG TPA: S8 family serine peptidase [Prolixibacteraceae bacterium]|nr:S8 family serine peptidase [Prolixibacteraceae bacterium]
MKKLNLYSAVFLACMTIAGCSDKDSLTSVNEETTLKSASVAAKYIVVLKNDATIANSDFTSRNAKVKEKAQGLLKKYAITGKVEEVYETALQGFTVKIAPGQAKRLGEDVNVMYVEADKVIALSPIEMYGKPAPQPVAQSVPWGITRVNGGVSAVGKTAWIIDTGIDLNHPDLTVDVNRSRTFLGANTTPDDQNGHGTHVSGTIAAKDNDIGVVGVAAGATVVAVRVLDRRGSGFTSGVIAGVNYVAANGVAGDVANMSLGGGVSTSLDDAVLGASKSVKFALAAGNESDNANNHSPARVNGNNIYTVSAMDKNDKFAYFSNYGNPPVDYCAPGVSIYSAYKDGGYATLSGTSMATPHVAGILLLGAVRSDSYVQGDPDKTPDPIAEH